MGTKNEPGKFDCYANAEPDEPMFVLLARDPAAPRAILEWIKVRKGMIETGAKPASDWPMIDEAVQCVSDMQAWRMNRRQG
jgi:hypothetical protein